MSVMNAYEKPPRSPERLRSGHTLALTARPDRDTDHAGIAGGHQDQAEIARLDRDILDVVAIAQVAAEHGRFATRARLWIPAVTKKVNIGGSRRHG